MAKSKRKIKEDEDQRIGTIKAPTQELEKIKLEQASLVQRYYELSNDYANTTNSVICVASLEKENQMLKTQVEKLTNEHVTLQGTHCWCRTPFGMKEYHNSSVCQGRSPGETITTRVTAQKSKQGHNCFVFNDPSDSYKGVFIAQRLTYSQV